MQPPVPDPRDGYTWISFFSDIADAKWLLTAALALWGAGLSTWTAFFKDRWQRKVDVRVTVREAAIVAHNGDSYDALAVNVANHGQPKVSFGLSVSFVVKDDAANVAYWVKNPEAPNLKFPLTLEHGHSFEVYASPKGLANVLKGVERKGKVQIAAQVSDGLNRRYKSPWVEFDLEYTWKDEAKAPLWGTG